MKILSPKNNKARQGIIDVQVNNEGSIFTFSLLTEAAKEFVAQYVHVEDYMWMGDSCFACEHRCAWDVAERMQNDGLIVK